MTLDLNVNQQWSNNERMALIFKKSVFILQDKLCSGGIKIIEYSSELKDKIFAKIKQKPMLHQKLFNMQSLSWCLVIKTYLVR